MNETQKAIEELKSKVEDLNRLLSLSGMTLELRDVIRNAVVVKEDSEAILTQTYTLASPTTVSAPKAYSGTIVVQGAGGRTYNVPYIN